MRQATGPGFVESRCVASMPTLRRLAWSLFNFDIDDASLKIEHQIWLDANLVPLLKQPGALIALRGTASRSGSDAYNKQLSERRVNTVRDFLKSRGGNVTQLATTSTGEDDARAAGQADGKEDARFRAVVVELSFPVANLPPRFQREQPTHHNDGFDDSEAFQPPWLLIRFEEPTRVVELVNGTGLEIVSTAPNIVAVEQAHATGRPMSRAAAEFQPVQLRGIMVGDAEVLVRNTCGQVLARLRVGVREKLIVHTAFHYVKNSRYGTRRRKLGDEVPFLAVMNKIYRDQANIEFVKLPGSRGARNLALMDNLGGEVSQVGNDETEWNAIVSNRFPEAQYNVFLVREVEQDAEGTCELDGVTPTDTANALTTIGGDGDCILEDNSSPKVGVTLAHEAGHCLGVRHNRPIVSTQDMLMLSDPDRGLFIPRIHAELMRAGVRRT